MEPGKWQCLLPFYRVFVDVMPGDISAFVAMSDLQGREKKGSNRLLGEVVAEELAVLEELGEVPKIDLTILAGDLYDYPDCNKKAGTGDISSVLNAFAAHFPNVVAVLGNHDMLGQAALADNVTVLDGDSCMIKGIIIGGVSGIIGRPGKNQRKDEASFLKAMEKATRKGLDLLVLHEGPKGPELDQYGSEAIKEFLLCQKRIGLVLFGHSFWERPLERIGAVDVLNLDSRVFVFTRATKSPA